MKKLQNKNNSKELQLPVKKYESFSSNRIFFIEQLLGILQFTIKKGLKKKLKRELNLLLLELYNKDNTFFYKFNKKLIQYKQPYKTISKRKKKWKRRLFSVKQKELRVTPFLKKNFFTKNFKRFYRRRPKNYLIFLNSKEQMHNIKKIYIDLVKSETTSQFRSTVSKQIKFFFNVKSLKAQKKIGWIKYLIRKYLRQKYPNKKFWNRYKAPVHYSKKFIYKRKLKFRLWRKKKRSKLWRFLKLKNKHYINNLNHSKIINKKSSVKTKTYIANSSKLSKNLSIYNKYFFYKFAKKVKLNRRDHIWKRNYTTKSLQIYQVVFYSSDKYHLTKVKKYIKNLLKNNLRVKLLVHPIQKKIKKVTVLKSPHVNKTARSQYDQINYKLRIEIQNKNLVNKKTIYLILVKLKTYFSFLDFSFKSTLL